MIRSHGNIDKRTYNNRFGSLEKACEEAGVSFKRKRDRTSQMVSIDQTEFISYEKVLSRVNFLAMELGRIPKAKECDGKGVPSFASVIRYHKKNWSFIIEDAKSINLAK